FLNVPETVCVDQEELALKMCGKYTFGQPVAGTVSMSLCRKTWSDDAQTCSVVSLEMDATGCASNAFKMAPLMEADDYPHELTFNATVTEEGTVRPLRAANLPRQHIGSAVGGTIKFTRYDGIPFASKTVYLFKGPERRAELLQTLTTDSDGVAQFSLNTNTINGNFKLIAENSSLVIDPVRDRFPCDTETPIPITYTFAGETFNMDSLDIMFVVFAKGEIVQHVVMQVPVSNGQPVIKGKGSFNLSVQPEMAPSVQVLVYCVLPSNKTLMADSRVFSTEKCFRNKVSVQLSSPTAVPGERSSLQLSAQPGSLCGLSMVDQSVFILAPGKQQDAHKRLGLKAITNMAVDKAKCKELMRKLQGAGTIGPLPAPMRVGAYAASSSYQGGSGYIEAKIEASNHSDADTRGATGSRPEGTQPHASAATPEGIRPEGTQPHASAATPEGIRPEGTQPHASAATPEGIRPEGDHQPQTSVARPEGAGPEGTQPPTPAATPGGVRPSVDELQTSAAMPGGVRPREAHPQTPAAMRGATGIRSEVTRQQTPELLGAGAGVPPVTRLAGENGVPGHCGAAPKSRRPGWPVPAREHRGGFAVNEAEEEEEAEAEAEEELKDANDVSEAADAESAGVTVRTVFPETWLWTLEEVGEPGTTQVPITVPDTITSWETEAFCLHPQGFGLAPSVKLTVFQPFFLELSLPYSIIRGETFQLKATVFNYLPKCIMVIVTPAPSSDFSLSPSADGQYSSCLCANGRKTFSWTLVPSTLGLMNITVAAEATSSQTPCGNELVTVPERGRIDIVTRPLLVKAEGTEKTESFNWLLCPKGGALTEEAELELPADVIKGSARASISVLGDILGRALKNMEGLLRMPYGCGEQNMAILSPNIYILQYLHNTGQLTTDIRERATNFLKSGYQRQLNYRHSDGAYSTFGKGDGNTWLTAFVMRSFGKAKAFTYIDPEVLKSAETWLRNKLMPSGVFQMQGKLFNNRMKGGVNDDITITAYITAAMLELDMAVPVRKSTMSFLKASVSDLSNMYSTALLAYTFSLAGEEEIRAQLLKHLDTVAASSG
ncbi:alpha-2-macroglobulin-like, partial [Engraulis encrasicolus]|uniref:alpha-2-macroglobulin-like n=1 Tax=Engraulis encrasicolus TaxID=184585 RepID=UPI002FD35750